MEKNKKQVVIITGASSGIGHATAKKFASNNCKVYGLARNDFETSDFEFLKCDVTNLDRVSEVISYIFEKEKQIDTLINCAGMGISGSVESTEEIQFRKIYDVNFFGTVNMCKVALPYMRKNSISHIVNISSIAGELPIPFQTFYSATKASIESFSAGLSMELKPQNIKVCCVLPGDTKTGFTKAREKNQVESEAYGNRIECSVKKMEKDEQSGMTPESVAKVIFKAVSKKDPKPIWVVGFQYKLVLFLNRILPKKLVYKILYKMYAK